MGLRIGTNVGALSALRNLRLAGTQEARALERLATGRAINRAADNPAGLVLLQQLTSETRALEAAIENTQRGANLIQTADAALGEINDILVDLNAATARAMNAGSPAERQALQQFVDQSVAAINRIAATTRFGDRNLVNGALGFQITNASPQLARVSVRSTAAVPFPQTVQVGVTAAATRAQAVGTIAAVQPADVTFRIQGVRGVEEITVQAGATQAQVVEAINAVSQFTGVEATATGEIRSLEVGSDQFVRVEFVNGTLAGITEGLTTGTDIQGTINGATARGRGNTLAISTPGLSAEVTVDPATTGTFQFTIAGGGARFQTGTGINDAVIVGLPDVGAASLGTSSGLGGLNALLTGGTASLQANPGAAQSILRAAITEVSTLRAQLGATQSRLLESQQNALAVHRQNLLSSRSILGDADFGLEMARLARSQLLRQSGVSVLRQSNLTAGAVLRLLG